MNGSAKPAVQRLRGNVALVLTAMIWGCAFAAQSAAADSIGPWLFNGIRFLMGGAEVLLLSPFLHQITGIQARKPDRRLFAAGSCAGAVLAFASVLQQAGIRYTTAGKAGFLTSLYVILVPLAEAFLLRKRLPQTAFPAALTAAAALFLLSGAETGTISRGDLLEILCACAFAGHILIIDRVSDSVDPIYFSAVQFLAAGVISMAGAVLLEPFSWSGIQKAMIPLLYAGLASAGLGYTLQVIGQRDADPSAVSVILSLESVFSVLFGYLLLHEVLSIRELAGCALMFAAVLLSQRKAKGER
ncbi:MAG: DMT family transporter [Solobacterium sp.]|nr:DMT family transporter [Solobacterium sp.]